MNKQGYRRLKALTVMELTIAMLISAIVVSIAYNSMDIFNRLYHRYLKTNDANYQFVLFDRIFKRDLDRAEVVFSAVSGITLQNFDEKRIRYEWQEDMVLRYRPGVEADTFYIYSRLQSLTFGNADCMNRPEAVVDQIRVVMIKEQEIIDAVYHKPYGANIYINYKDKIDP